jgi:hypothetical protein
VIDDQLQAEARRCHDVNKTDSATGFLNGPDSFIYILEHTPALTKPLLLMVLLEEKSLDKPTVGGYVEEKASVKRETS